MVSGPSAPIWQGESEGAVDGRAVGSASPATALPVGTIPRGTRASNGTRP